MRRHYAILLALVAAVGGVIALAVTKELNKGLDLQGGLEIVYEAQPAAGQEVTDEDLDQAVEIFRNRIDKLGISEPVVTKQGGNQVAVQLAGVFDQARAQEIIGKTAQLQFYDLEGDLVAPSIDGDGFPVPSFELYPLLSGLQERALQGTPSQWFLFSADDELLAGPAPSREGLLAELPDREKPEGAKELAVPSDRIVVTCSAESSDICPGGAQSFEPVEGQPAFYLFRYQPNDAERPVPEMTGDDLEQRGTRQDFGPGGQAIVTMRFTSEGGEKFHDITRALAQRGQFRANSLGIQDELAFQHFAIVLDDEIRSFPQIDFNSLPDGIAGDSAQIEGLSSLDEAKDLALVLQTGSLPIEFVQVDSTQVSATLGQQSLDEALWAAIGGLAAVALFLLIFYRFLGVVAIVGLAIYGAFLYGAILLFDVTLTLPGFAGLVLTIGVAADANIVIFERIKEEVRLGRSVRVAIGQGYRKGFGTIVDANVVTMITAFVLFAVATSSVRGFALMLLIGTIISMITAVAATRAMLALLSGFRWFDNPAFMGATAQKIPMWQRIDFIGKRRVWFTLSAVVIVVGIVSLGVRGLNLGIDFQGGTQVDFTTPQALPIEDVRTAVADIAEGAPVVQGRGEGQAGNFASFQIRTESLTAEDQAAVQRTLEAAPFEAESISIRNVSGSFSEQILRNALIAILVSLILIAIYVTVRFQWRFAVPVLVALGHDILITLGVYSLSGRELTTATVAALLTILGFSIYDTIIIFDRVRENIPIMRRSSFAAIANQSLWETIRRSLATTFITLLPVASLFVFGGSTLKDFAFALLIGITAGAYSTIFIATPLLATIMERLPEYAARKGDTQPVEKLLDEPTPVPVERRSRRRAVAPVGPAGVTVIEEVVEPEVVADADAVVVDDDDVEEQALVPDVERSDEDVIPEEKDAAARRAARRERRRSRPHGRAR